MVIAFDRIENIVEKGEYAGYRHFLLYPQWFQKNSFLASLKPRIIWQNSIIG